MIKVAKRIITPFIVKFSHKKTFWVLRLSECPKLWVWLSRDFWFCFGKNADQNYIWFSDWKVLLGSIESNFSDLWITPLWKISCTTPTDPFLRRSRYIENDGGLRDGIKQDFFSSESVIYVPYITSNMNANIIAAFFLVTIFHLSSGLFFGPVQSECRSDRDCQTSAARGRCQEIIRSFWCDIGSK